ncbi:MAG TPA: SGNH hydrolase domain-containing protein, partial [Amaricoccus sp.]|nr:SGNH hydrolase domain-containing protein [Amaricoccus sp.]
HQPLFGLARISSLTTPSPALMAALALGSLLLAWLTWRWVEQPFRRRSGGRVSGRAVVFASCLAAAALAGVGIHGQATEGRRQTWMAANPEKAPVYDLHRAAMRIEGVYLDDGACRFNVPRTDARTVARLLDCRERHGPGVAIFGDSHASDFFNGVNAAYDGDFVFGMTLGGCWMRTDPGTTCDFNAFASLLREHPGLFRLVLYHQAGYRYLETADGETGPQILGRIPENAPVPVEDFRVLDARIDEGLAFLEELARSAPLVWVGPRIEPRIRLNYVLRGGCRHDYALRSGQSGLFRALDRHLAGAAADAGIAYVSLIEALRLEMPADFMTCDDLYWRDGDHWSAAGAKRFVRRFLERTPIEALAGLRGGTRLR